jgi:UDP-glucose 6-dehydrogenase
MKSKPLLGFIGQGFVGKTYADNFARRGYTCVRYALEEPHVKNRNRIAECDIVFIAVPTPTTPRGFDATFLTKTLPLVGKGKIAVIKSTIVPGTAVELQRRFPKVVLLYSPEFLSEKTAVHDVAHPFMNVAGMAKNSVGHKKAARLINVIVPQAPFALICTSTEAEFIKYAHNVGGYAQIVMFNLFYDLSQKLSARWEVIERAVKADPYIPNRYATPVHKKGRGAGGHCFIKDFAAFRELFEKRGKDKLGIAVFKALEAKNTELLLSTHKDLNLLRGVYGSRIQRKGR